MGCGAGVAWFGEAGRAGGCGPGGLPDSAWGMGLGAENGGGAVHGPSMRALVELSDHGFLGHERGWLRSGMGRADRCCVMETVAQKTFISRRRPSGSRAKNDARSGAHEHGAGVG